jgi:hypothetical protein
MSNIKNASCFVAQKNCIGLLIPVPVQKVREKRNRYTFAEQKPPEGYNYTHSLKIAFRLFKVEWV